MSTNTPGEITESRIDEVSLVFQGADQDSELVVLSKSVIEEPAVCAECGNMPCDCDPEEGESEEEAKDCGANPVQVGEAGEAKEAEAEKGCKVQKAYEDLLAVSPVEWPEEIKSGMTDAVLSLYTESVEKADAVDLIPSFESLEKRIAELEVQIHKATSARPEAVLSDEEILAKASEIEAARKQAEQPAVVVQKSIDPRLLAQIDALQSSVEKLGATVSREMGVSTNH